MDEKQVWLFVLPWSVDIGGGVNRVVLELCREMQSAGGRYRPGILINDWSATTPIVKSNDDLLEVRYRMPEPTLRLKALLTFVLWMPKALLDIGGIFRRHRVAVVNPHFPGTSALTLLLCRAFFKRPLVLSVHGSEISSLQISNWWDRFLWRQLGHHADAIVACADHLAKKTADVLSLPLGKIRVVKNGLAADFAARHASMPIAPFTLPKDYVLNVGTFIPLKGQKTLLRAFAKVASRLPDVALVFVGRDGSELLSLQKLRDELSLSESVFFFVNIPPEQLPTFYRAASLLCSTSLTESFSMVLLEASAFRLPVIATRIPATLELIEHESEGLLVEVEDVDALAIAIENLMRDSMLRESLGAALHLKVLKKYTQRQMWERYLAVIEGLSDSRN